MNLKTFLLRRWLSWHGVTWSGASPGCYDWRFPRIQIRPGSSIHLGSHCFFGRGAELGAFDGGKLVIGDRVLINENSRISAMRSIRIGSNTAIAPDVVIFDCSMHEVAPDCPIEARPVVIGRNVWLGTRTIILPGVTIGDHSVVGAGTVVARSIPPRTKVVGAAARVVGSINCNDTWIRK